MADIAAELGERDKYLPRIGHAAAMRLVAAPRGGAKQRAQVFNLCQRDRLVPAEPAIKRQMFEHKHGTHVIAE